MKRNVFPVNIAYQYEPKTHKGAPYSFDGERWKNGGEFAEIITKSVLGYKAEKDANTPFDKGSDIEELRASVKSSKFTLTSEKIGSSFEEVMAHYFERVHSTSWIYTVIVDDTAVLYYMNKKEFEAFLKAFAGYAEDREVIRGKATSATMIRWFEDRL